MSGVRIGLSLRTARERRELTLAAVANELCIRADYLAALENERFDKLPGAAYARAWLRVYAEYLDLDSAPLLDVYEAEHKPPAETEIFHRPLPVGHHLPVRPLFALGLATLLFAVGGVLFLGLTAQRTVKNAQPPAVAPKPKAKPKPVKVAPVAERQPVQTAPVPVFLRAVGAWDPVRRPHRARLGGARGDGREPGHLLAHRGLLGRARQAGRRAAARRRAARRASPGGRRDRHARLHGRDPGGGEPHRPVPRRLGPGGGLHAHRVQGARQRPALLGGVDHAPRPRRARGRGECAALSAVSRSRRRAPSYQARL